MQDLAPGLFMHAAGILVARQADRLIRQRHSMVYVVTLCPSVARSGWSIFCRQSNQRVGVKLAVAGMNSSITIAKSEEEILACYSVMAELRPHIQRAEFLPTVKRLTAVAGFQLAYLTDGEIKAVAGFRISEWLAGGKYLEIEDLVAKSEARSKGYGGELFDWLVEHAQANHCLQVRLVSRVSRLDAHRFYVRKGMNFEAHYFSLNLQ